MLDIKDIIERKDWYKERIAIKNVSVDSIDEAVVLYEKRNEVRQKAELLKSEQNTMAKSFATSDDKEGLKKQMEALKSQIQELKPQEESLSKDLDTILKSLPNPAHDSVRPGKGEEGNEVIRYMGTKPAFDFKPKPHWVLGEELDLIDTSAGASVAGARFHFLKNELVLLQFALVQHVFAVTTKYGFQPMIPPYMVNRETAFGTGFLDSGHEEEVYCVNPGRDDLYLIGTSEVPNTAYLANTIIPEEKLPIKYISYSPCFRREAGSGGKDEKGILRCHQFDKLEMAVFAHPDKSWEEHEKLREIEEEIWGDLGIPYQLVDICGGDLGAQAAKKYDLEAWMPGQDAYREITSTSNCTDFQARRLKIRMKDRNGKNRILHTLNGTGIAINRCMIAIMENFQTKDGEILMPKVLHKWLSFTKISKK